MAFSVYKNIFLSYVPISTIDALQSEEAGYYRLDIAVNNMLRVEVLQPCYGLPELTGVQSASRRYKLHGQLTSRSRSEAVT